MDVSLSHGMMITPRDAMAIAMFVMGVVACLAGLWTLTAKEYQQALKGISAQSNRIHARGLTEVGVVPLIDSSARLVEAVTQMVRTAMGVGAFLCLIGLALCLIGYWMLVLAPAA
jgi:hypothetical protein